MGFYFWHCCRRIPTTSPTLLLPFRSSGCREITRSLLLRKWMTRRWSSTELTLNAVIYNLKHTIDWIRQIQLQYSYIYLNQGGFILHGFESLPIEFVDRSFCDEYSSFTRLEALIVLAYSRSKQDLLDPIFSFQRDQSRRGVQLIPYVVSLPSTIQPVTGALPLQCVSSSNLSSRTRIMLLNVSFFS
jgi:hypothetical protein